MKKKIKKPRAKFEVAGSITVDAGIVQIGDPCYSYTGNHDEWMEYITTGGILDMEDSVTIPHTEGQDWARENNVGKAVIVTSGFGDGVYDVLVKKDLETGRVKELKVKFF